MPSLIDLRRRIRSVKNTQQITKAMKMVSAAKVRKAQDRVLAARPYATIFGQMLADVAAAIGQDEQAGQHPLLQRRPERRTVLILLTSHRGLAGAYNSNLIRTAQSFMAGHDETEVSLITIGRKGRDFFRKRGASILAERNDLANATFEDARAIGGEVAGRYEREEIDAAWIVGAQFKSLASQEVKLRKLLPFDLPAGAGRDYIYEQPPAELLGTLLPRYVEIAVYQAMLESAASEHAARMVAMEAATKNAGEVIDRLTLYMNRVRQASITNEIIEVVSGAAAL
jgi:F-type H+-transporting ATPase subunit gamma